MQLPTRENWRKENEDAKVTESKTDNELLMYALPNTEVAEPKRQIDRTERIDPTDTKSRTEQLEPRRPKHRNERVDPKVVWDSIDMALPKRVCENTERIP
jgi:hypothetical protein